MFGYHVTFEKNFQRIAECGIEVRNTREHNWNIENEPGVYFWTDLRKALDWGFGGISCHARKQQWRKCIIKFVVPDPSEVRADYVWQDETCRFSMVPIPPENLVDVIPQEDFTDAYHEVRVRFH